MAYCRNVNPSDFNTLPGNLPVPLDDGACDHLLNLIVPSIALLATTGQEVCLTDASQAQRIVVYCYPMTGNLARRCRRAGMRFPARGVARRNRARFGIIMSSCCNSVQACSG